jgi:hypothetical protein
VLISENLSDRYSVTVESPVSTSDHKSVLCVPNTILKDNSSFFKHIVYDYRHSNIVNFVSCVKNIDWNLLIASDIDVNSKCDIFQTTLNDCFVNCIPTNEVYMTNCEPPWFTPLLKLLINQRWEAFRQGNFIRYNYLKIKVKNMIDRAKISCASRSSKSTNSLWRTTHSILGTNSSDPLQTLFTQYSDCHTAANNVNDYLKTVFKTDNYFVRPDDSFIDARPDMDCTITSHSVLKALYSYPDKKASGCDGIPTFLYKIIAPIICDILAHIFNLSLECGIFPSIWKKAHVIAVPKCAKPVISDLRPISLLPGTSKIFEKIVYSHFIDTLAVLPVALLRQSKYIIPCSIL